ncbi:MAG: hypothetical protein KME52_23730 [Desmonostoc geniculatum HA4340-LM1]|jgi:hypothetical protein|nr:hypothetical protein [Desmonostoc geniculatum HA4340-LM1]
MLLTKDRNSNNENIGIKTSNASIKTPDIFDDSNNYFSSSVTGVNSFRASDRSSYTPREVYTSAGERVVQVITTPTFTYPKIKPSVLKIAT